MINFLRRANRFANRHASKLFLVGLAGVALYNWHLWGRDKAQLAQKAPPKPLPSLEEWPNLPKISVLVAAWNESENIDNHIHSFLSLRYPNKELVLCAGGSDGTYQIASQHAGQQVVVLEQQPGEGKQRALRRCFAYSSGEIIYLTDADCLLDNITFENNILPIIQNEEFVVTAGYRPLHSQIAHPFVRMQWFIHNYQRVRQPLYVNGLIGRNSALSKEAINSIGGLPEDVLTGTDYYLARILINNGFRIRYNKNTIETFFHTKKIPYIKQQSRWIRNILIHGRTFHAQEQFVNALFQCISGIIFILLPLTSILTKTYGFYIWFILLTHGIFSRFRYIRFGQISLKLDHRTDIFLHSPIYLLLDQIMLMYAFLEWVIPMRKWRW